MATRVLAVDLGSSSVRALVFEAGRDGTVGPVPGALARRARQLSTGQVGQATFDADDYVGALVACLDELHQGGWLDGVTEVATDSQWHSALAVGVDGCPVSEVVSWADTRPRWSPSARAAPVPDDEAGEALRQRTGCALAPTYWTWRVPWLRQGCGSTPARYLGLSEYVGQALLADPSMSVAMASGTGLLATAELDWDGEALALAGLGPGELPELAPPGWYGRLAAGWARRWPALADARWHPVVGDGAAANLGVGCDGPGRVAMTIGTSAAVRAVRKAPDRTTLPAGLWRYCVDRERVVVGAAYSSGGQLYAWALSLWEGMGRQARPGRGGPGGAEGAGSEPDYDIAEPAPAGSRGVLVMPWHAGTRPPEPAVPGGRGMVLGLGLGHDGSDIVSAAVEAVCFQLAGGLEDLERAGDGTGGPLQVVANGGAVDRSPWWRRRLASVLGRTVQCPTVPETTARGAAVLALGNGAGPGGPAGGGAGQVDVVEPVEAEVARLAELRGDWRRWYEALRPLAGGPGAL
jgi:gluconokinase